MIRLEQGDCLEVMDRLIEEGVKVDAIICDPPYGTTTCKWDVIIPFDEMWKRLKLLRKDDKTPVILFGSEPFSSNLRISNLKEYRYDWIWNKNRSGSFALAKKRPFQFHEIVSIFYKKQCLYNPQFRGYAKASLNKKEILKVVGSKTKTQGIDTVDTTYNYERGAYPKMTIDFKVDRKNRVHPTQKPVLLLEYLIKTYTDEGDVVLDFTMGSGTTGVACKILGRNFIGIELDENYFNIAKDRIGV